MAQQLLLPPPDVLKRTIELLRKVTVKLQLSGAELTTDVAVPTA